MIITTTKPMEEILKNLEGEKSVFIMGCGECATACRTGGEREVRIMKEALETAGKTVSGSCVPEAPCLAVKLRPSLRDQKAEIEAADSIMILACGLAAQSVRDNLPGARSIHIGCNTLFMGQVDKRGIFLERCSACGECMLEETGMVCPVTRCPKSLVNGPCGGQDRGKCEVDRTMDCAWITIYNTLKEKNQLERFRKIQNPKPHSKAGKPRRLQLR